MLVKTQNKSALGVMGVDRNKGGHLLLSSRIIFYKLRKRENDLEGGLVGYPIPSD